MVTKKAVDKLDKTLRKGGREAKLERARDGAANAEIAALERKAETFKQLDFEAGEQLETAHEMAPEEVALEVQQFEEEYGVHSSDSLAIEHDR
jgi:hypothetical protein